MGHGFGMWIKRGPSKLVLWIAQSDLENVTFFFGDIALDRYRNSYHVLNDRTVISRLYPRA